MIHLPWNHSEDSCKSQVKQIIKLTQTLFMFLVSSTSILFSLGIQVFYDLAQPRGKRVIELLARCNHCRVPDYFPVVHDEIYEVAMSSFLASGGDGYEIIKNNIIEHQLTGQWTKLWKSNDVSLAVSLGYIFKWIPNRCSRLWFNHRIHWQTFADNRRQWAAHTLYEWDKSRSLQLVSNVDILFHSHFQSFHVVVILTFYTILMWIDISTPLHRPTDVYYLSTNWTDTQGHISHD